MEEYGELREPGFTDMEVAFRIIFYLSQNEVIEVRNSNRDLDDLIRDLDAPDILKYYSPAFASSSSRAISPRTSENATSFRPLLVTTSA